MKIMHNTIAPAQHNFWLPKTLTFILTS